MLCARRTRLLLALLSLQLLVACASGLTLTRDPQRRFYRYTPRKDADTAGSVQWEPLRLADGRLVRDSDSARSFQRRYTLATPQERRTLLGRAILNEASPHGTAAMDAYYHGTSLVRRGEPRAAREAFATARSLDTTLSYVSDLDLWDAWSARMLGDSDATTRFREFTERSTGLCPASAELASCDDPKLYQELLDSLAAFAPVATDTGYFANRRTHAANLKRDAYGIAPRRKELGLGLAIDANSGLALVPELRFPLGSRLEPDILGVYASGLALLGGGLRTTLVSDPDNRYGVKLLTFAYRTWREDDGHSFAFPQALMGLEGSWAPQRDWLLFVSAGKFYHDRDNKAFFVRQPWIYELWSEDYVDIGTTWYYSKDGGVTVKEFRRAPELGWQYGRLFLGWNFRKNYLAMSFQGFSELF